MKATDFNEISMNGRMAYVIICIEKYLLAKYPARNWTALSDILWSATSNYWDEWDSKYLEIIPEFLFEFSSYEEADFECISKEEYDLFSSLLKGLPNEINQILLIPHALQEIYCYSDIPGIGEEATDIVIDLCNILEKNDIELPELSLVSFSKFSEKNGWGNRFDGKNLSLILV